MKEEARKLIAEWDETNGEGWSDCSEDIADIMVSFAKVQLEQLLDELKSLKRHGIDFNDYVDSPVDDVIFAEELDVLAQNWETKL
jgi:hypothetical protein